MARDRSQLSTRRRRCDRPIRRPRCEVSWRRRDGVLRLSEAHDDDAERAARTGLVIVEMLTAVSNRRGHMPGCVSRAIAAHIRWLRKQLAEFDATLEEAIRRS